MPQGLFWQRKEKRSWIKKNVLQYSLVIHLMILKLIFTLMDNNEVEVASVQVCGAGDVCRSAVTFAWLLQNIICKGYFSDRLACMHTVTFCYSGIVSESVFLHLRIAMHFLSVQLDYSAWCVKRQTAEHLVWLVVVNCVYSWGRYPSYKHRINHI